MADVTRIQKITNTEKAASQTPAYSDFYSNFNRHPESGILVRTLNEESVKRSLKNLLMTNKGERMFQPELGADLNRLLFENMTEFTEDLIRTYIEEAIERYEPRVRVLRVVVAGNDVKNAYDIAIIFEIINSNNPVTFNLTLYRVR